MQSRRRYRHKNSKLRYLYWVFYSLLLMIALDTLYVWKIWPNWKTIQTGPVPKSAFIKSYENLKAKQRTLPRLRWYPVKRRSISTHVSRAVVVAEDSRFYSHKGIDVKAISEAMEYNIKNMKFSYGGSTISQQTTKNLFLSSSKNPLRKWHEVLLTVGMENNVSKRRILHLYLNIAEFGRGIYGVEAASRYYWGQSAYSLSPLQAIELAATLPSPKKHNPRTRTKRFLRRVEKIARFMKLLSGNYSYRH